MELKNINFILTIIMFILIFKIFNKINKEKFANTDDPSENIWDYLDSKPPVESEESMIYKIIQDTYKSDIQAIQTLSDIANKIQKAGNFEVPGNLLVYGNLTATKDLNVGGLASIKGDVSIGGTLDVTKTTNFKDFVNVSKDLTVDGDSLINGDVYAKRGYNLLK